MYSALLWANTLVFLACLLAYVEQLTRVYRRKRHDIEKSDNPVYATESLSENAVFAGFFSYYAFALYAWYLPQTALLIVASRAIACAIAVLYLWEIWRERKSCGSRTFLSLAVILLSLSIVVIAAPHPPENWGLNTGKWLSLASVLLLVPGHMAQIKLIKINQSTGVLSLPWNSLVALKDGLNVALGCSIGWHDGWPLIVFGLVLGAFKLRIIAQLLHYRRHN